MINTNSGHGLGAMRKTNTLKKAVSRARQSHEGAPSVPKSWDDMIVPAHLSVTVRGGEFLAVEETTTPVSSEKIVIFCSQDQKDVMKTAQYWVADGTFDVVSKTLFSQLFIITSMSQTGVTVPTLFALLPNKETSSYQRVFQFLRDEGVEPPESLKTDFEKGIIRGFLNVFPGVTVNGCDTHFKRALRRKLTSTDIGLGSLYANSEEFQTLVRYIWALSLVPPAMIIPVWEDFIQDRYNELKPAFEDEAEAVEDWLGYVERTYIGALNWRTGNRKSPMFAHSLWSKFAVVLENEALTSNSAEGFNAALALSLPRNCSIWTLIKQLQSEENTNIRKLMDVALGAQNNVATNQTSSRNIARDQRREELKSLVGNYNKVTLNVYMSSLIDFFNR